MNIPKKTDLPVMDREVWWIFWEKFEADLTIL
jgi:hypothetical protein